MLSNIDLKKISKQIDELKLYYPYTKFIYYPYKKIDFVELKVIAVNRKVINQLRSTEEDLKKEYSKEIRIIIKSDYATNGCHVFGGAWLDKKLLPKKDIHFYSRDKDGNYELCVGIPGSFKNYSNPILESVKTVESMLSAYELFQKGKTKKLELLAYSHGQKGIYEYKRRNQQNSKELRKQ